MRGEKSWTHPCLRCGACCSYFRVSFYWREAEPADAEHPVPKDLFEESSGNFRCMKGTNEKRANRCVALKGEVGKNVSCQIYQNRPSPCHDFGASYEHGLRNPKCDQARAAHRLEALKPSDWIREDRPTETHAQQPVTAELLIPPILDST